jgi:quercetin dioxygenase-like cupin family protein
MYRLSCPFVLALMVLGGFYALAEDQGARWLLHQPNQIEWRAAESLPPGAEIAILEGDPSKEGFFTMRIRMPDGYRVPPHWHPKQERVTVLSGVLNLGNGSTFDPKETKALSPGAYSSMPPRMTHFAWMTGETVLQLSSIGPWTITYVRPQDDPRNKDTRPSTSP